MNESALFEHRFWLPQFDAIHHDLLWLPDAAGHVAAIAATQQF